MDFVPAVKTCLMEKYADFNGRASRSEFWWFLLASFIFNAVVGGVFSGIAVAASAAAGSDMSWITYLGNVVELVILVPSIAVTVRRLHDIGKSGWWYLIAFVCCIGGIYLIYLCAQESDGDNEYGPVPMD